MIDYICYMYMYIVFVTCTCTLYLLVNSLHLSLSIFLPSFLSGDVESTEPTKMLMRIADNVDNGTPAIREWFLSTRQEILDMLAEEKDKERAEKERCSNSTMLKRSIVQNL